MDIEQLKKFLTPQSMDDVAKIRKLGGICESDATNVQAGFDAARKDFLGLYQSEANYMTYPNAERTAYMKKCKENVETIQNNKIVPGHNHISVGAAVFCKELEQIEEGNSNTFSVE